MTITARTTETRLRAAALTLDYLQARLPKAVANIHLAINTGDWGDDRPRADDAGIRSKGAISDPTATTAIHRQTSVDAHLTDVVDQLESLRLTLGLLSNAADRWGAIETTVTRCNGGAVGGCLEPWTRPTCHEYVEHERYADGRIVERQHGLCATCRRRRDRWRHDNPELAA